MLPHQHSWPHTNDNLVQKYVLNQVKLKEIVGDTEINYNTSYRWTHHQAMSSMLPIFFFKPHLAASKTRAYKRLVYVEGTIIIGAEHATKLQINSQDVQSNPTSGKHIFFIEVIIFCSKLQVITRACSWYKLWCFSNLPTSLLFILTKKRQIYEMKGWNIKQSLCLPTYSRLKFKSSK